MKIHSFPFSAIVGNDDIKLGLIVNAIDQSIGGILITGPKGIAKSTIVRSLSSILPEITTINGCRFHCDPDDDMCDECLQRSANSPIDRVNMKVKMVNLPNSTTLDRVVGSLDISHAIRGETFLKGGLIGEANRGILYIDEVNLLDDAIVNSILDATASGINIVEREGVSYTHPARFIMVGTMNPEEGELRPQLTDRFGISVKGKMVESPENLLEIVKRVNEFDKNRQEFIKKFEPLDDDIRIKIVKAREMLNMVKMSREYMIFTAELVLKNSLSNRAMISAVKTAKALAAYDGRLEVNQSDLKKALEFAFGHRLVEKGKPMPDFEFNNNEKDDGDTNKNGQNQESMHNRHSPDEKKQNEDAEDDERKGTDRRMPPTGDLDIKHMEHIQTKKAGNSGRSKQAMHLGMKSGNQLDLRSSLINTWNNGFRMINDRTIVVKETYSRGSIPFIIAIDSSASMNFSSRIQIAKELSEMLLKKLYLIRSRVALVEFSGKSARVIMNFSKNFTTLKSEINNIKGGGKTPLYDALKSIYLLSSYEKMKTISLLITDGRGNVFPDDPVRCLKDISCKIMPLSELYIIDRNNNRFLPSYRDLIETWGGAKVIDDLNSVL